jgi:hypothetical protein
MNRGNRRALSRTALVAVGLAACTEFFGTHPSGEGDPSNPSLDGSKEASQSDVSEALDGAEEASQSDVSEALDAPNDGAQGAERDSDARDASAWSWTPTPSDGVTKSGVVRIAFGTKDCPDAFDVGEELDGGHAADAGTSVYQCSGVMITNRWVLTSRSCMCLVGASTAEPTNMRIYTYTGDAPTEHPALHCGFADHVVLHNEYDIALVRLDQTLPFEYPPQIYPGDGNDLQGQSTTAWGYGPNRLNAAGTPTGQGETLNKATMRVLELGSLGEQLEPSNPCNALLPDKPSEGLIAEPADRAPALPLIGATGGPLFWGDDPRTRVLVGVLKGTSPSSPAHYGYTGLWLLRDWIVEHAPDITRRNAAFIPLPGTSKNTFGPSIAEDSDGGMHIVAVEQDQSVRHWRKQGKGPLQQPQTVPHVRTAHAVGVGQEYTAVAGSPFMALVYRESETGKVRYARWSEASGWMAPLHVLSATTPTAPAIAAQGFIAYVKDDGRIGTTIYNPALQSFGQEALLPATAPQVDVNRRLSVVFNNVFAVAFVGYLTPTNEWVHFYGSFNCPLFWCDPAVRIQTDWQSASFAYAVPQRVMLVSSRYLNPLATTAELENHVVLSNEGQWPWGFATQAIYGHVSAAIVAEDIWVVSPSPFGILLQKADNTFANEFR